MRAEFKVGGLILLAAGLIVAASIVVTGWNPELDETYRIGALFRNSGGLQTGSAVRVAGIKVGTVDAIELEGSEARVILKLYAKYPIYRDSAATIKSVGILGDKFVEVLQGNSMSGTMQDGDEIELVIPGSDIDSMIDSLGSILRDVKSVTGALDRSLGGVQGEQRLTRILDNSLLNLRPSLLRTDLDCDKWWTISTVSPNPSPKMGLKSRAISVAFLKKTAALLKVVSIIWTAPWPS